MDTTRYKIGDLINNENGLGLQVQEIDNFYCKKDVIYKTVCTKCRYIFEKVAKNLEKQKICAGCITKSVSLKYDVDGNFTSINGISPFEYIYDLMATYNLSGSDASELCIQILIQKPADDPANDEVTV